MTVSGTSKMNPLQRFKTEKEESKKQMDTLSAVIAVGAAGMAGMSVRGFYSSQEKRFPNILFPFSYERRLLNGESVGKKFEYVPPSIPISLYPMSITPEIVRKIIRGEDPPLLLPKTSYFRTETKYPIFMTDEAAAFAAATKVLPSVADKLYDNQKALDSWISSLTPYAKSSPVIKRELIILDSAKKRLFTNSSQFATILISSVRASIKHGLPR